MLAIGTPVSVLSAAENIWRWHSADEIFSSSPPPANTHSKSTGTRLTDAIADGIGWSWFPSHAQHSATISFTTTTTTTTTTTPEQYHFWPGITGREISLPTLPKRLDEETWLWPATGAVLLASFAIAALCIRKRCEQKGLARTASLGGTDGECSDSDEEDQKAFKPNELPTDAFTEDEFRRILSDSEQDEPLLALTAPTAETAWYDNPASRAKAAAEVERVLAVRNSCDIFGAGTIAERKAEFRRLARLLHPDKRLVTGDRASLALRRVVEAARHLQAVA